MEAFSRAAAKRDEPSGSDFLEAVLRERPDLKGQMAYFPEQGGCAHTVFIGDEVFKGPQGWLLCGSDHSYFDREHELLSQLEGHGLPVPKITCVGKEACFYGMTRMPGVMLSDVLALLGDAETRALAHDIVDCVVGIAEALPPKAGMFACHHDLHTNNIMVDPVTKKLTGIIDFGVFGYAPKEALKNFIYVPFKSLVLAEYEVAKAKLPDFRAMQPVWDF
ncbi:MAG: phosphotransferase [Alphaproteobacteria bacterium]|nr:phosphotransferase [Alphaproteobacteria bacterium]MDE2337341.1 phosphotransferase [Alphaproteobacteria bacterium]